MTNAADYERSPLVPADRRLPVYLLTGYLGSGKTSLLKHWLQDPLLRDAALIINELGEVGLDNQLLASASESASLVANACVCCTGLPGLEEALEELFWARLHQRVPLFPCVVIETTGLAEPGPVVQALTDTELLRERYRLAGVITCLSAATADEVLPRHQEARAQLAGSDLLVLTKTDLVDEVTLAALQRRLRHQLAHEHSTARLLTSAHASLSATQMLQGLQERKAANAPHPRQHGQLDAHHPDAAHDHHPHEHAAQALWRALPGPVVGQALLAQIRSLQAALGPDLLRLKGRVMTDEGPWLIQLAPFELVPTVSKDILAPSDEAGPGLTLIVAQPLERAGSQFLTSWMQAAPR